MTEPIVEQDFDSTIKAQRQRLTTKVYERLLAAATAEEMLTYAQAAAILKNTGFLKLPSRRVRLDDQSDPTVP